MSEKKWTPAQQAVIEARDCDLLVSAAAGSGKTAVLVQRIIEKVTDQKHPMDIDRLLVVTFTKAAAREMKERIRAAITTAAEADPKNAHLALQMTLVHNAQITTIDSFCTNLVRNNFHRINLEPDFRIADEGEMTLLRQDVLDRVFEKFYTEQDDGFLQLVKSYGSKNRDLAVSEMVLKLYETAQSYPWPLQWLSQASDVYRITTEEELTKSEWMQWFINLQKTRIKDVHENVLSALNLAKLPDGPDGYIPMLESDLVQVEGLLECNTYRELQTMFSNIKFAALSRKKAPDEDLKTKTKQIRDSYKKTLEDIQKAFAADMNEAAASMKELLPVMENLVKVCVRFTEDFSEAKRKKNVLDFNDLEHMALNILREEDGTLKETAYELQQQFDEIMVDEYQDSNYLQEAILTAAAKTDTGGHNMFMVGDVKQSIYSFRQARPQLFMDKMHRYQSWTEAASGDEGTVRIDLAMNFRSRAQVLETTNDIFYRIMAENLGNVPYDDKVALYTGNTNYPMPQGTEKSKDPAKDPYACEVLIADSDPELLEQAEMDNKVSLEAKIVGDKIRGLRKTLKITDAETGELRGLRWKDVVILMRSPSSQGSGEAYVESLMEQGIPAHLTSAQGYFDTPEVSVMLSLLSVINNQMQDIPLMAVMHSKIGGFTNEEAMIIRGAYPSAPSFHESCRMLLLYLKQEQKQAQEQKQEQVHEQLQKQSREQEKEHAADAGSQNIIIESIDEIVSGPAMEISEALAHKLPAFFDFLSNARERAQEVSIHVLIEELLEETGYLDYMTGLPQGAVRRANLQKLVDRAIAFEGTSYRGLSRFMKYIEKMKKYEMDFGSAELIGEEDDAVRIISIHKSKGLEYPVVFLSGCGKNFNEADTRGAMVIQSESGVALDWVDPEKRTRKKTVYKNTLSLMNRTQMLGEELRILYVALTRAKEKLIITGTMKDAEEKIARWRASSLGLSEKKALPFSDRYKAKCYLDWIVPALLAEGETYSSAISIVQPVTEETEELIAEIEQQQEDILTLPASADLALVEEIDRRLSYRYPHVRQAGIKAKYSVSEIKRRAIQSALSEAPELPMSFPETQGNEADNSKGRTHIIPSFISETEQFMKDSEKSAEDSEKSAEDSEKSAVNSEGADDTESRRTLAAIRGTAMHRALECFDFAAEDFSSSLKEQISRMTETGKLTEEQSRLLNIKKLQNFLNSDLAQRVHQAAAEGTLFKEQAFVMGGYEEEFSSSDMILIQGIIDGFFEEEDGFVLYDYKTDRVHSEQELVRRYRTQLLLYADAIERTHDKPVKEILIYSFSLNRIIPVKR